MKHFLTIAAGALLLAGAPASAATLLYTVTGAYTASFELNNKPVSLVDPSDPNAFFVFDVPGTFGGYAGIGGLTFYSAAEGGGFTTTFLNPDTSTYDLSNPVGLQLFTGPLSHPTLLAFGPTIFTDYYDPRLTYTISAIVTDVPEPASWAMMIAGLGLIGGLSRRRPIVRLATSRA